jgi:predicted TPR repeat methyltransferase
MNNQSPGEYRGESAIQYESQAAGSTWHGHEILFGLMYEFINPGEALLDMGIGTGLSSVLFHKAGLHISGFDNSTDMLEGCKSKGFSGKIIQHDFRNIPFPYETGTFDHIISLAVLNFYADLTSVFKEVARIIKSKGIFAFTVEEQKAGQKDHYTILVNKDANQSVGRYKVVMYRHSDRLIGDLLESAGFSVLKRFEFLADRYPEQGIDVFLKIYIARRKETQAGEQSQPAY